MKKTLIAANWKSNKSKSEAKSWLEETSLLEIPDSLEVVIFPPFTLLDVISGYIRVNDLPFKLGGQDVSMFDSGSYTGEISAQQIKEFADYVLIGHSERRSNFSEDVAQILKKVEKSKAQGLTPIVCISELSQLKDLNSPEIVFAYEPLESIGNGKPEDPKAVEEFVNKIKADFQNDVIYGGSVNSQNVKTYLKCPGISGVLIGGASLSPAEFLGIIKNAY